MTDSLPDKVRVTNYWWSEEQCAYKVTIGDDSMTVAYAWAPGGCGDRQSREKAMRIAERICEGWNA